ncbi:MAG: trypsin-like serine protease [Deltaproteobacteria bacterium]|nr:trypsin-like serine protease [Deltaproteobacteria bacterium]
MRRGGGHGWSIFTFVCICQVFLPGFFAFADVDYSSLTKGVVKIVAKETGAGVILANTDGVATIVTAWHVVKDAQAVTVRFPGKANVPFAANVYQFDTKLDLAVLTVQPTAEKKIPQALPRFLRGDVERLNLGDRISAIGHPAGADWQLAALANTLQNINATDSRLFEFTNQSIDEGNSGGPVFDEQGRLIGIVKAIVPPSRAEAVKIGVILTTLKNWQIDPTQLDEEQGNTAGMVRIPAGEFFMGCNKDVDTECDSDEATSRLNLSEFLIDQTEVTVAQFAQCVDANKCSSQGLTMPYWDNKEQPEFAWACNWGKAGRESHPVNCVEWNQAKAFCESVEKRLPTEAEWEKAARGTDGRKYPWGNIGYEAVGKAANITDETAKKNQPTWKIAEGYDDGFYGTAPVGSFLGGKSPYGALDMVGNVWEWAADWYDEKKNARVVRGGSWYSRPQHARASARLGYEPGSRDDVVGFRCAQ